MLFEMPALALFSKSSLLRFQLLGAHFEHWRVAYCVVKRPLAGKTLIKMHEFLTFRIAGGIL
jgi:hypothetical protein